MKKLPITKEAFEKSKYFTNKYGKLEYVSESGKVFKTEKGKILKFKESNEMVSEMDGDYYGGVRLSGKYDPVPSYADTGSKKKKPKKGAKKPTPLTVGELLDLIEAENVPDDAIVCAGGDVVLNVNYAAPLTAEYSTYIKDKNRLELTNLKAAKEEMGFSESRKFKESYDQSLDSAWDEYHEEIPKYLKELDEELYMACTMTDEYRGKHFSTGERELNWDFQSSEDKALHAVVKEIEAEVGEKIDLVDFVTNYISGKELAHRVVDYILERKPGKALARKLAKIGY